jgi:hypothetical protein
VAVAPVLYPFAPWEGGAAHFVNAMGATMGPLLGVIDAVSGLVGHLWLVLRRADRGGMCGLLATLHSARSGAGLAPMA